MNLNVYKKKSKCKFSIEHFYINKKNMIYSWNKVNVMELLSGNPHIVEIGRNWKNEW